MNSDGHLEKQLPSRSWLAVLFLVVAFFIVSITMAYRSIGLMHENNQSISNTLQVLTLIKDLKTEVVNAENGQRGFLLTGDGQYLEPYHRALKRIDELLGELSEASTELPAQQDRFESVYELVQRKIDELQRLVAMVHQGERRRAIEALRTDVGIAMQRELADRLDEMEADEKRLLYENRASATADRELILFTLIATNVIGLLLSLGIYIAVYRNSRKEAELYAQIEMANAYLEDKVEDRTHALQKYSDELQRSNRELEEFAFVASHDLQEPLRKIRAFGDRLLQKYSDSLGERGADYVGRMHSASERMSQLIDDLLSFSRVTTKQKPFTRVDLNQVVHQVTDDLEYAIDEAGASVNLGELPTLDADASQMGQVFMNLIGNSLKFRRDDRPPQIDISAETGDHCRVWHEDEPDDDEREWCCLTLQDNGIGFEPQYADRVFNLFQRLHGRDQYKGTGIGLALCRKIIERHGGQIEAHSEVGEGTRFVIKLPLTHYQPDAGEETQE